MLLPDHEIATHLKNGWIKIDPFDEWMLQPASVDVQLGTEVMWHRMGEGHTRTVPIDPFNVDPNDLVRSSIEDGPFILHPGRLCLATTLQRVEVPAHLQVQLDGKSTLARNGLMIHTAGFVDPGFRGQITLEMTNFNNRPIALTAGMPIGQISFMRLSSPAQRPYGHVDLKSHYQEQIGVQSAQSLHRVPVLD